MIRFIKICTVIPIFGINTTDVRMSLTREQVLQMDILELSGLLDECHLQYNHLETLNEIQELYLMHVAGSESDENVLHPTLMEGIVANDRTMRVELSSIYDMLISLLNSHEEAIAIKTIMDAMHEELNNINTLTTFKDELMNDECPIVIAGETSAGKSSLLNLILGTDILAHSLLGTTTAICRLHNSDTKHFEVFLDNGEVIKVERTEEMANSDEAWKDVLQPFVTRRRPACKQVDVYWPIPMLKEHVTIVDTPGIGENDQLTDVLLSYLPKAVAFIYVINSANSGGIQDDYLLRILNQQKIWAMEGRPTAINYESTMFVCNKWDRVQHEGEEVWENSKKKILDNLPGFPVEQMFKMSVVEEERRRKSGLGMTTHFRELMKGIEKLAALSMKGKIRKQYTWIENFLMNMHSQILSRINQGKKKKKDREKLLQDACERLDKLSTDADKVKTKLLNVAEQECLEMVDNLEKYLQTKAVRESVLTWNDSDFSDIEGSADYSVIELQVQEKIQSRIKDVFMDWGTQSKDVEDASKKLRTMFLSECQLLGKECKHINLLIAGEHDSESDEFEATNDVQTTTENSPLLSETENLVIGLTMPIWFPLAAASAVLVLPVVVGVAFVSAVQDVCRIESFLKNKARYMREWAQVAIDTAFTRPCIRQFIFKVHNDAFVRQIDRLCSDFIPKQIAADRQLIHDIMQDDRSLMDFTPLLFKIRVILGKLRMYKIDYLNSETKIDVTQEQPIYLGAFCNVFKERLTKTDSTEVKVAVKVFNDITYENVTEATLGKLDEIACLRKLNHPNIVDVFGICCTKNETTQDKKLTLVLELCEGNLEDTVFKNEGLQCWKFNSSERHEAFTLYLTMTIGICKGLVEIHLQRYLHKNLKLSNVLVKQQTAKLCHLSFAKTDDFMTEPLYTRSISHMSPELLRSQRFTFSSDIYSLGTLLWELWYGRNVSTEEHYDRSRDILEAIKTGLHPKMTYKYSPPDDLQALITECWDSDPTKRPSAFQVCIRLGDIQSKVVKQD